VSFEFTERRLARAARRAQRCTTEGVDAALAAVEIVVIEMTAARATKQANMASRRRVFFWAVAMVARRFDMMEDLYISFWTNPETSDLEQL
jgi:hypothetical protein